MPRLLPTVGELDHLAKPNNLSRTFTRQKFLGVAGAGAAYVALLSLPGCREEQRSHSSPPAQPDDVRTFRSRPDLSPPAIRITTQAHCTTPGYIFIAAKKGLGQDGPLIVDDFGRPVWFAKDRYATDFKVQHYRGEPVITWWQGKIVAGHGEGEYVIFDDSYREITRVQAGNGYRGDLHEFSITPQDTALLTSYFATRDGPLPDRRPQGWHGLGVDRPGARPRDQRGALRVAQPGPRGRRGVRPRARRRTPARLSTTSTSTQT